MKLLIYCYVISEWNNGSCWSNYETFISFPSYGHGCILFNRYDFIRGVYLDVSAFMPNTHNWCHPPTFLTTVTQIIIRGTCTLSSTIHVHSCTFLSTIWNKLRNKINFSSSSNSRSSKGQSRSLPHTCFRTKSYLQSDPCVPHVVMIGSNPRLDDRKSPTSSTLLPLSYFLLSFIIEW